MSDVSSSNPSALLAEAAALSGQHFGPDPLAPAPGGGMGAAPSGVDATLAEADALLSGSGDPAEAALDPTPAEPYQFDTFRVHEVLRRTLPEVRAALDQPGDVGTCVSVLNAVPREVTALMDETGLLGAPAGWELLREIGNNMKAAGADAGVLDGDVSMDALADHARAHGLPDDLASLDGVARLIGSLPPEVRAGISAEIATDPEVWELAAHLGGKLWGYECRVPVRRPAPEPSRPATVKRPPADPDPYGVGARRRSFESRFNTRRF